MQVSIQNLIIQYQWHLYSEAQWAWESVSAMLCSRWILMIMPYPKSIALANCVTNSLFYNTCFRVRFSIIHNQHQHISSIINWGSMQVQNINMIIISPIKNFHVVNYFVNYGVSYDVNYVGNWDSKLRSIWRSIRRSIRRSLRRSLLRDILRSLRRNFWRNLRRFLRRRLLRIIFTNFLKHCFQF